MLTIIDYTVLIDKYQNFCIVVNGAWISVYGTPFTIIQKFDIMIYAKYNIGVSKRAFSFIFFSKLCKFAYLSYKK